MAAKSLTPLVGHILQMAEEPALRPLSDGELLERFTVGKDRAALEVLVRRHGQLVAAACRQVLSDPAEVDDAFQATFLTLVLRGGSIRKKEAVGSWLYGTAHRVAVQARANTRRRQRREAEAARLTVREAAAPDPSWREAVGVLHEELDRLPDRYRLPLLLCYLQGKSRDEAAEQLGVTPGAVKWRLERGRQALRKRLLRRRITLGAALLGALADSSAACALPPRLIQATLQAATAGPIPATVAALTGGVSTVLASNSKLTAALVLCLALLAGFAAHRALAPLSASPPPDKPTPARESGPPQPGQPVAKDSKDATRVTVHGKVLDPDGKPVEGAKVLFVRNHWYFNETPSDHRLAKGTTDARGRFRFTVVRTAITDLKLNRGGGRVLPLLLAVKKGFGPAWLIVSNPEDASDATLQLVEDVPITGQVLDLEGKPIEGVRIRVHRIATSKGEDVAAWAEGLKKGWSYPGVLLTAVAPPPTLTGRAGRFHLHGIGRSRLVLLRFEGPSIETRHVYAMTLKRPTARIPLDGAEGGLLVLHGASVKHIAAPTRPVVGTVRNKETGKPIAGIEVRTRVPADPLRPWVEEDISTTTDREGQYRLAGLSRQPGQAIEAQAPSDLPYLPDVQLTERTEELKPARLDFALDRGVLIHGKVTDGATGKPIPGVEISYVAFADNPHLKTLPGFSRSRQRRTLSQEDGTFTCIALPGRGLVAAKLDQGGGQSPYLVGIGADRIKGLRERGGTNAFITEPARILPLLWNTMVEVNPDRGADPVRYDVVLDPGKTVTGRFIGPEGKPVKGVQVRGSWGLGGGVRGSFPTARFTLSGVNPYQPRPFFFYQREKQVAAALLLKGDEPEGFVVKLQKAGTLTGRLLDAAGQPLANKTLSGYIEEGQLGLTGGWYGFFEGRTDKQGRFRIEDLVPNVIISARYLDQGVLGNKVLQKFSLHPGEVKDLGDITISSDRGS
jgi:RNA polymerase sigma factor (sigma-70 family)